MSLLNFKQSYYLKILLILSFFVLFISTSSIVDAQSANNPDPIGEKLCKIVDVLSGKTAKALCIVAIFVLGITVLMGKVNWGTAAVTVCGIVLITQAATIYGWIANGSSTGSSSGTQATCASSAGS
ncbi:trbC/VIRB2 family protein [Orientia chuto str. Dubai]|uniref:TrbC/VIRB2 family protein n=1 Tax=Orientia chuto str. Dubai TaxID=1359168 RepID=A0A0F3MJV2_9RICK|nr:TrbC/VirB2 family protein [Candidatus Orientia mediorientalis]KJV56030.1 trbC/VIRB2 family protein [Orientia chuto str. Dubai]